MRPLSAYDLTVRHPVKKSHRREPIGTLVRIFKRLTGPLVRASIWDLIKSQNQFNSDVYTILLDLVGQQAKDSAAVISLNQNIADIKVFQKITDLEKVLNEYIWGLEKFNMTIGDRFFKLENDLANMEERIHNNSDGTKELKNNLQIFNASLTKVEGQNEKHGSRLDETQASMKKLHSLLKEAKGQNEKHRSRLDETQASMKKLHGLLTEVKSQSEKHENRLDETQESIERMNNLLTEVKEHDFKNEHNNNLIFNIFEQEIRPMGLLFPRPQSSFSEYTNSILSLEKEDVENCWVCGSGSNKIFGEKEGLTILECEECEFRYVSPRISKTYLRKIYNKNYWFERQNENNLSDIYTRAAFDYNRALTRVLSLKPFKSHGRWLDIGCGNGALLRRGSEFGYKTIGLEVDSEIANIANSLFQVQVEVGQIENYPFKKSKFDIVSMFDLFEHLYDPHCVLKKISQLLKKDGILVIETFRVDSPDYLRDPLNHPDTKPIEHVGMYQNKHIDKVLLENGFRVIETSFPNGEQNSRVIKVCSLSEGNPK